MKTLFSTRWGALLSALLFLLLSARAAIAADPLVSFDWLKANLGKPGIAIVDFQPPPDYLRAHIPGAVNSSYAKRLQIQGADHRTAGFLQCGKPRQLVLYICQQPGVLHLHRARFAAVAGGL